MPIKRIVAATDLSQASALALGRAERLAAAHSAELHLVTAMPANWRDELRAWFAGAEVQADAGVIRQRLADSVSAPAGAISVALEVLDGDPRDAVAAYAERRAVQLVVVGAHGRSLVGETVLGSTALALMERCDAPILVVRNEATRDYRHVLAGVAVSEACAQAVCFAAELCPEADLTLLHAYQDPYAAELFLGQANPDAEAYYRSRSREQAQQALAGFVGRLGPLAARCHPLLAYGPPGVLLAHEAQHQRADLVVLGSRSKGRLEAALLGSVASNVALMVTADVLLVRERATPSGAEAD